MKYAIAALVSLISFSAARADSHPFAGLWGEMGASKKVVRSAIEEEAACYNKFTEQLPDGRFRYYLVDHEKWIQSRSVEYILAQEGVCTLDTEGGAETCKGHVVGEREQEWFVVHNERHGDQLEATYYENRFYFEKRINGEPLSRWKCPFEIERIKLYIKGKSIRDCIGRCRAFGESETSSLLELVNFIKRRQQD